MRQVALALINYINDNRGILPPAFVSQEVGSPYPDGWFWAAELMHQGYIAAPNIYPNGVAATGTAKGTASTNKFNLTPASPFRCPEGIAPTDLNGGSGTSTTTAAGNFPTASQNNGYVYGAADNPRYDGGTPYGVASWYQLCSRETGYTDDDFPLTTGSSSVGANNEPFLYYDSSKDTFAGPPAMSSATIGGQLSYTLWRRNVSMIRHSAIMCMIAEAASLNWVSNTSTLNNGETMWIPRWAARHGQTSSNGNNAYTNVAFFDGHVASFFTQQIEDFTNPADGNKGGTPEISQSFGIVFTLSQDQ